jgi:hypothetical protein
VVEAVEDFSMRTDEDEERIIKQKIIAIPFIIYYTLFVIV